MASNGTIAHRFANRDYNFERGLKGSSTHISGNNYYSYSTVFGQWVDEKLCIVYWGDTSITSHKHKLYPSSFPKDVTVLPYDDKWNNNGTSYYNYYHGCDLLGWRGEFNFDKRAELIDYYVHNIYTALKAINGGTKKGLDTQAERIISEYWGYVMKLCAMYRDTTINKWLRKKRIDLDGEWKLKKRLVRELDAQNMSVSSLVDILFGEGTWKRYYDYCARFRKAADKKEQVEWLCNRLGIGSPYVSYRGRDGLLAHSMTADEIRKLTAKQRIDYHFAAIMHKEQNDKESERRDKYNRNNRNAYKWIVGYEPMTDSMWSNSISKRCKFVRNMWTGDEYIVDEDGFRSTSRLWGMKLDVRFECDEFRKSEDKEEWIRNFYAECIEVDRNLRALHIFDRFGDAVRTEQLVDYSNYTIYVINDVLRGGTTDEEFKLCEDFVNRWNAILQDKQTRYRAERLARKQREEEERKEREYMEQVKQEQIDACLERGTEGCRDLWRKHYMDIHQAERETNYKGEDFFYGGNVLLRFNMNKDKVETSKNIRIPVEVCKKMWKIVSRWHENPSSFKPMQIDTKGNGKYTISSYDNDILTAGCHDIAYAEMERMYNEIVALENNAA